MHPAEQMPGIVQPSQVLNGSAVWKDCACNSQMLGTVHVTFCLALCTSAAAGRSQRLKCQAVCIVRIHVDLLSISDLWCSFSTYTIGVAPCVDFFRARGGS